MENPSDKEWEVLLILQCLPELILSPPQRLRSPSHFTRWAIKKTRTRRIHRPKELPPLASRQLESQSPPLSLSNRHGRMLLLSTKTEKLQAEASTSSPASPLYFYPSGDDTDKERVVTADAEVSTSATPPKKTKQKRKELMEDHANTAGRPSEIQKRLKQEKAECVKHRDRLLEENSRLKTILSKSKLAAAKEEQHHPHLLQQCRNELRTYPTPLGPGGPTACQSPDRLLESSGREEALSKTAAGPLPVQPPTQFSAEQKPMFCLTAPTLPVQQRLDPPPFRFWTFDGRCFRVVEATPPQVSVDRLGSPDTEIAVAGRSQQSAAKRKATAEARKRRLEIKRMKSAGAAATGAAFGNPAWVGLTACQR